MILGDSIGVGISTQRPECVAYVKGGINSFQWNNKNLGKNLVAKNVIISLGSNDYAEIHTFAELLTLRQVTQADRVYWIVPAIKPRVQDHVRSIATSYGDVVLEIPHLSKDKVHPTLTGYKELAKRTKNETK